MSTDAIGLTATRAPLISGARVGSPPGPLLMIMGDYWLESDGDIPSAALVALLGDLGVTAVAGRAALARTVKRGLLRSTKSGRNTGYRPSEQGGQRLQDGSRRLVEFGEPVASWSGVWSLVAFDIPEYPRSLRASVRSRLVRLGFAPLFDEVWICPHDRHDEAVRELGALGVAATPFRATLADTEMPIRSPQNAWELGELEGRYRDFMEQAQGALDDLAGGRVTPREAFVARTRLLQSWFDLSGHDPELPDVFLPPNWPRERARLLLRHAHAELAALATSHVRSVVAAFDRSAADLVELRTSADWARMARRNITD